MNVYVYFRVDETAFSILLHSKGVKNIQSRKSLGVSLKGLQCHTKSIPLTVVMAASRHKNGEYVAKLKASISSFIKAGNETKSRLVVFDMGMEKEQKQDIQQLLNQIQGDADDRTLAQMMTFSQGNVGDHFKLGAHQTVRCDAI